jgi:MerR family transcriptional regulator, light-induced transcriptional regulator
VQIVDVVWAPAYSAANGGRITVRLFDRYRTDAVYNTRAVVQRTGVPADTLRAWERRYGVPNPPRTQGNQRLYSDRDIALITWLRDQTRQGLSISQAVTLLKVETPSDVTNPSDDIESDRLRLSGSTRGVVTSSRTGDDRLGEYRDRVIAALAAFDTGAADRAIEEAIALAAVDDVCRYVLAAAMIEIGHRWQQGEVRIVVEHFSSSFVMRKLSSLFNLSLPQHGRGPIVAATVEGELHELGLLLTCLVLSRHGFKIVYIGPNLPLEELLVIVDDLNPPLVLLSASTELALPALVQTADAIRDHGQRHPTMIPAAVVGYGGRVFIDRPDLRTCIDGTYLGETQQEVVDAVERIMSASPISWSR